MTIYFYYIKLLHDNFLKKGNFGTKIKLKS